MAFAITNSRSSNRNLRGNSSSQHLLKLGWQVVVLLVLASNVESFSERYCFTNEPSGSTESDDSDYDPCTSVSEETADELISRYRLRFYYGNSDYLEVPLDSATEILAHPEFDNDACTVLYSFGYIRTPESPDTKAIIDAFLSRGGYNLIVNDYSPVAELSQYTEVVDMMETTAEALAQAMDDLVDEGAKLCLFIGHSTGAHLSGQIPRYMQNSVPHVIALEPSGEFFYGPYDCSKGVNRDDAECVEVMHTDGCGIGTLKKVGTVDIYFNGGSAPQPGCGEASMPPVTNTCNHDQAVYYFAEAWRNGSQFLGRRCNSLEDFNREKCNNNPTILMGHCDKRKAGTYYLRTSNSPPYGKGEEGIRIRV